LPSALLALGQVILESLQAPVSLFLTVVLQGRFIVLASIVDANDVHGVISYLEQDGHSPPKAQRPQAQPKIVAPRASVREGLWFSQ
jgi:hypothetical protein